MILIRGIKGERYARDIERGVVGCRDVLSTLFSPFKTGYSFSDYLEKNLITAITQCVGRKARDFKNPSMLCSILTDYYLPYIYLTYFHILNPNSLAWLESFNDEDNDTFFIAVDVELDELTYTAIGNGFIGSEMKYIDRIQNEDQNRPSPFTVSIICSIENRFPDCLDSNEAVTIYNTLAFPLLHREVNARFTDFEHEFRIIAYDCPTFVKSKVLHIKRRKQIFRDITINGESGRKYEGILRPGQNYLLHEKDNNKQKRMPKLLSEVIFEENGNINLESKFKQQNISSIASSCRFIGNKRDCAKYIIEMNSRPLYDVLVNRTVINKHSLDDPDISFAPCKRIIKY